MAGFAVAAAVLALFVAGLGAGRVESALRSADPATYALAPAATLLVIALWTGTLVVLLRTVPGVHRGRRFLGAYATGLFLVDVAPWGRTGGSVLVSYGIARRSTASYERVLAAVLVAGVLKFVASLAVAAAGAAFLLRAAALPASVLRPWVAVTGSAVVLVGAAAVFVARPGVLVRVALGAAALLRATVGRASPTVGAVLGREALGGRIDRFFETTRALAVSGRTLLAALALAVLGWACAALPMYVSLRAVGVSVPLPVLLLVVPLGGFAGAVPLPGGTGGVEVAYVALLGLLVDAPLATLGAGVLLYRLATYWFMLVVNGAASAALAPGSPVADVPS